MPSYRVSKSTSTATATTTSVSVSGDSQPEPAIDRHQQGSFAGLSTTAYTPELRYLPADERYAELRLSAEIIAPQLPIDPFKALATYQTVSLNDDAHEQSASFLSLSDEPSPAADDAKPIMAVEEPKPRSGQNIADQNAYSTDKWIKYSGDETKPFKCGYEGCGRKYVRKHTLRRHFITHIGDSQFRCYAENCTGAIRYCDSQALARHIHREHSMKRPFTCEICNNQFVRVDHLFTHRRNVHSVKDEQKQPQNSATDKWIIYSGDETRPFQCGYEVCGKTYITKQALRRHFVSHIGDSQFRCYHGNCAGRIRYWDKQALARHIHTKHKIERPFKCEICTNGFMRPDHLKRHKEKAHSTEKE